MDAIIKKLFLQNWQRKLTAVLVAIGVWVFVNNTITETKLVYKVPVRIVNIPSGQTVKGLLPGGILQKRVTLTLTGTKSVIDQIEPGDIEVIIDVANTPDEHLAHITKSDLNSLNPDIDLTRSIRTVSYKDISIRKSRLITAKIPVYIRRPLAGRSPEGYQFQDIWPSQLHHTVSGPEDEMQKLRVKGLKLHFNLDQISKNDLDMQEALMEGGSDELSFTVPKRWKKVQIPFLNNTLEEINDPSADFMKIFFLKKEANPVQDKIPIRIFYPIPHLETLNPNTLQFAENEILRKENGISFLHLPLHTKDVSRSFLDVIKYNYAIIINAEPKGEKETLNWSLGFVNAARMEDRYVALHQQGTPQTPEEEEDFIEREMLNRNLFQEYLKQFTLYNSNNKKLKLKIRIIDGKMVVEDS